MNKNNKKHVNLKNKTMRRKSLSKRSNNKYTQKKIRHNVTDMCLKTINYSSFFFIKK